ncbi:MAG: DMT family protein [Rhodobacteraceae bacterium]|nr:DMT family protein [Paracoccaceae bacterium]
MNPYIAPILMLGASNVFMTFAWYGHLKVKAAPLIAIILVSWAIAFFEYCLAVPANRIGAQVYTPAQLKTIQEVMTLTVFVGFSAFYLKQAISWQVLLGFAFIAVGSALVFFAPGKPILVHPSAAHAGPTAAQEQRVP